MIFPTDFRQKVAMPPAINGNGYPYKLSAEDLMRNFEYAALDVAYGDTSLAITEQNGKRFISSKGGTGSITFLDCDGAEVGRLDWSNGLITTESNQFIEGGCQVVSSSAP